MHSELFSLFGLTIHAYGLMLAIGFVCCYLLAQRLARLEGRNPRENDTLIMVTAICGILGARVVYVIQNWQHEFAGQPLQVFRLWKGGLVFYGGFLMALAGLAAYALLKREKIAELWGFCAVFVPLGHGFGRIGCFFHGCCFGARTQGWLGVRFPAHSPAWIQQVNMGEISRHAVRALPVLPTQLFEAAGCFLLFGALWWLYRRGGSGRGACVCGVYGIAYAVMRFGLEFLRDDPRGERFLGLSFSQCISMGVLMAGIAFLVVSYMEKRHGTIDR